MSEFARYRLEAAIADAAREAFSSAVATNPDHEFFAFALTTLSGVQYIECSLNSERNLKNVLAAARPGLASEHYYKWYPNEWGDFEYYGQRGHDFFGPVQGVLSKIEARAGGKKFNARRKYVFDSMIAALRALDGEGCFGCDEVRRNRIVFADVMMTKSRPSCATDPFTRSMRARPRST